MATLTVQKAPVIGLAQVSFQAATVSGDDALATAGAVLLVKNDDVSPHTVTVDTPGSVDGLDIENPAVAVAAGDIAAIPLVGRVFGSPVSWTYDAVTSLTVAAIQPAR